MLPYITPERFVEMGFGSADASDAQLLSLITRATMAVDRYVSAPMVPTRFSFRGGTVVGEEHVFNLGNQVNEHPTRIVWPNCTPLKSVSAFAVWVTNDYNVEFDVNELYLTKENFHITSIGLTSASLFGAIAVPVLGLKEPISKTTYTYGYDFDAVGEVLAADSAFKVYRAVNQFWNDDDVTVYKNGSEVTTGFDVNRTEGKVTFTAANAASDVISVDYGYQMPTEVAEATGLTVAKFIDDRDMRARGMGNLQTLEVGEISMSKPRPRAATSNMSVDLPNEAKQLLDGLQFITIR